MLFVLLLKGSRVCSVGIATGYGLDDRVSITGKGWEFFSSPPLCPDQLWRPPNFPIHWVPAVASPGGKADHSSPSSAEVKNAWSYTSIPQYVFMAWCLIRLGYVFTAWYLVKHRDNFTSTLLLQEAVLEMCLCVMKLVLESNFGF
jgi:hypothetical protein